VFAIDADFVLLALAFLLVATLYSSVGHAGASGYIAAMALIGMLPEQIRPTALALNLVVGGIGLWRFRRAGFVRVRSVLPFVLASAPAAYFGAQLSLPPVVYERVLGAILLFAAWAVFRSARDVARAEAETTPRAPPWLPSLLAGGVIGLLSGLTGTGGAIFLTPLLLFAGWARTREASGISVAFVWINSLLALAGLWQSGAHFPPQLPVMLGIVAVGALIGTQLGLRWLPLRGLRYALSLVLLIAAGKLLV